MITECNKNIVKSVFISAAKLLKKIVLLNMPQLNVSCYNYSMENDIDDLNYKL